MEKRTDPEAVKKQFLAEPWSCPYCGEGRIRHQKGGITGLSPNPSWMHCPDCKEQWLAIYDHHRHLVDVDFTKSSALQEKIEGLKELLEQAEDLMDEVERTVKFKYTDEHGQLCSCEVCNALDCMKDFRSKIIEALA